MNKPRITYLSYMPEIHIGDYWRCDDGSNHGYGVGIGSTAEESYNNYIRQSWLRRLINWWKS